MPFPNGTAIGKYKIKGFIGAGHFGEVYRVRDRAIDADSALKLLPIADPKHYVELVEAKIQHKCRHQNCVTINSADVKSVGGTPYACIDMELMTGGSLESLLERQFLSVRHAVKLITDVPFGLEHAHCQGIVHKDIKPGNILLVGDVAKLSDFGLSEEMNEYGKGSGLFAYVTHQPPEFFSSSEITIKSDIYSLGMTLYRLVNNINDWQVKLQNLSNVETHVTKGSLIAAVGWQPWVPEKIRKIILKACASHPDRRYNSVREYRQATDRISWINDWSRITPTQWSVQGTRLAEISITTTAPFKFESKVNGRRQNAATRQFLSSSAALDYLHEYIATSTLS